MTSASGHGGYPLAISERVLLSLWGLMLLAGFCVAFQLTPDTRGFGTHEQLGFLPCTIRRLFAISCPTCGMTTSLAYFVRADFVRAAQTNWAGLLVALWGVVQIPWILVSLYQGRLWKIQHPSTMLVRHLAVLVGLSVLRWLWLVGSDSL